MKRPLLAVKSGSARDESLCGRPVEAEIDATLDGRRPARRALSAAVLGFFIITLDALVVSVALPAIRDSLGGGITGLQWVMDGYTLPFAAFLLLAGTLSDRIGGRRAFGAGLIVFIVSSFACALVSTLRLLIAARVVQGLGAAMMTPASLALISDVFPDRTEKARAIGLWAVGGAVASASGPLIGGALTALSWRLIFLINLPVGLMALWLLRGAPRPRRRETTFAWVGQSTALIGLTALTFGLIESGEVGLGDPAVIGSLAVAAVAAPLFFVTQSRNAGAAVPLKLFRPRTAAVPLAIGFTFMVGFYGMVFLMSLFLQEQRGLSAFATGLAFLPVTGFSIFMPIIAARIAARVGAWVPITAGQVAMAAGLLGLSMVLSTASVPIIVALMVLVGFGAGMAMPSATSLLLNTVPEDRSGIASGVLNTSRQVGGAVAIASFGALIAAQGYNGGGALSLAIAGTMLAGTAIASSWLRSAGH